MNARTAAKEPKKRARRPAHYGPEPGLKGRNVAKGRGVIENLVKKAEKNSSCYPLSGGIETQGGLTKDL